MELEFDVRITANVLYDYMLRHTYYSMSGLIGTIVGALMFVCFFFRGDVIFLIAGAVILGYLPWTLWIKSRRQMLGTPAFQKPRKGSRFPRTGKCRSRNGRIWTGLYLRSEA